MLRHTAAAFLMLAVAGTTCAQVWTTSGPEGGFASEIVVHPAVPDLVYAVTERGIARSTDGGVTWEPTSAEAMYYLGNLVIDPNVAGRLFIHAGRNDKVFRSTDDGSSWTEVLQDRDYFVLKACPETVPLTLLAFSWRYSRLLRSSNLGDAWEELADRIDPDDPDAPIHDLLPLPPYPGLVLAVVRGSVFRSEDGGLSWSASGTGLDTTIRSLTWVGPGRHLIWAVGEYGSLFTSGDEGLSWQSAPGFPSEHGSVERLVVSPHHPDELYAITWNDRLYHSSDSGASWSAAPGFNELDTVFAVTYDPVDPRRIFVGGALFPHGIHCSRDSGLTWTASASGLPLAEISDVDLDPFDPVTVYAVAGSAGRSIHGGVYRSSDRGESWRLLPGSEHAWRSLSLDPHSPGVIYAGGGGLLRSGDSGRTWIEDQSELAGNGVYTVAADPHRPGTVFAASSENFYRSDDWGQTWRSLTRDGFQLFDVWSISFQPGQPGTLYAVGGIELNVSRDWGDTWTNLWPANCTPSCPAYFHGLAIDPLQPLRLHLATEAHVYLSTDGGLTWQDSHDGIDVECYGGPVSWSCDGPAAVTASPTQAGVLFVATGNWFYPDLGTGVYRSSDFGETWKPFNRGLSWPGGVDLEITPDGRTLYLAASEGGVAVLHMDPVRPPSGRLP